ncbi:hypothetical protein EVC12_060 [Rhizobium phage RHph_I42]|nr:hypothetical protein EVC12_060 [Rhizobium phage RHph_I42]
MYADAKDKALENLRTELRKAFGIDEVADTVLEALTNYVDEVVREASSDLRNQINKTGEYDPDY